MSDKEIYDAKLIKEAKAQGKLPTEIMKMLNCSYAYYKTLDEKNKEEENEAVRG